MDVIIIPPSGLGGVYDDNRTWARQFAAAEPRERAIEELAQPNHETNVAATAVAATRRAVTSAGSQGTVIYAVGHGGGTADRPEAGSCDFAPRKQLRVTQFVAFWDVSTSWSLLSVRDIETDLRGARSTRNATARRSALASWRRRYFTDSTHAEEQVLDRARVQPYYAELAQIYHEHRVRRVLLLTCNVGNSTDFLNELSADLGVPVAGYTRQVQSQRDGGRVRMYLAGDDIGHGTNTARAFTELPNDDLRIGRVPLPATATPRVAGGARTPGPVGR